MRGLSGDVSIWPDRFYGNRNREGGMAMKKITVRKASAIKLTTSIVIGPSYAAC